MNTWKITRTEAGQYIVALPVRIAATSQGWTVPALSVPLDNAEPVNGGTVTQVREAAAKAVWGKIQEGVLPVPVGQVKAVRLFSTVVTDYPRMGDMSGPMVQVPAFADRPDGWWVATDESAGVLAGHKQTGATVGEATEKLIEGLMLELEVNPQGVAESWSGIQLQLTSRKTYPAEAFTA